MFSTVSYISLTFLHYPHHFLQAVQLNLIERNCDHNHQFLDAILSTQTTLQTPEIKPFRFTARDFLASFANVSERKKPIGFLIGKVADYNNSGVESKIVDLVLKISK